ncbi:MAG TPA: alpha-amylase family glycosyl hydrolase [Kiritimatiellia bacterium]|nr:alpha-amylase family glycosyl hydrolase [Kiritimatiellia bacterium]
MRLIFGALLGWALAAGTLTAQEPPLSPDVRLIPGERPTRWLRYVHTTGTQVEISGTWNQWARAFPLVRTNQQLFVIDITKLPLEKPGRYEFKFIVDGQWEPGENRALVVNDNRQLERPPDVVLAARLDARDEITVYLKRPVANPEAIRASLEPAVPVRGVRFAPGSPEVMARGYLIAGPTLKFQFDEKLYGVNIPPSALVTVAGNFNWWNPDGGRGGVWQLHDEDDDGVWELALPLEGLPYPESDPFPMFRFVINGDQWMTAPGQAPNRIRDPNGNINLKLDPNDGGVPTIKILTAEPMSLSTSYNVVLDGVADRRVRQILSVGRLLDSITTTKELGAHLNKARGITTYRLFAPRATAVHLNLFTTPGFEVHTPTHRRLPPAERYPMIKDETDGVWEINLLGLDTGKYYSFNVDGPQGDGEAFNAQAYISDPYSFASAHSMNNSIVVDREATNQWFGGWTATNWKTPRLEDLVIYEAHVRDLTIHPSAGVQPNLRGTYEGVLATLGTGAGLDHIRDMGFNAIEFLPTCEFENNTRDYGWGYNTVHFFAPEASYGRQPLRASQYYEFKRMVDGLHRAGFAVLKDVVYNHVGGPNLFAMIDKKYFFRLTPDYRFINFSACGNDVRTEAPMMRRFIVDNILYWMREHKVDGFRFDLAELIDMETMRQIEREARALNPDVILISEPWSIRGQNKEKLRGTTWSAWNNDFRYAAKDFARGKADREWMKKVITGSTEIWAANPLQAVNYVESHDDMALADELSLRPDRNGKYATAYEAGMNKLAVTVLFTSLGIPMVNEGQEFLRSKYGISNTYNKGDAVNAIRWDDRDEPLAKAVMAYYRDLISLRRSDAGRAFRVTQTPPPGYYEWLTPPDEPRAMGYIVNGRAQHPGRGFVVLLNGGDNPVTFNVPLPPGRWRVVGNHDVVQLDGLSAYPQLVGGQSHNLLVGGIKSLILMNGF